MQWIRVESAAYWCAFVAAFLAVAIWESYRPKYALSNPAGRRWRNHGILVLLSAAFSTVVLRATPVAVALLFSSRKIGLSAPGVPELFSFAATVLLMDFARYGTHWLFHKIPWLWRVHQVHHSDPDFDVSTGLRAHPMETLLNQTATLGMIAATAAPPAAVIAGEVLGVVQSFLQHANVRQSAGLEALVRKVLVTSDMHRIHHSEVVSEQMTNYGEIFPWWDRLFGTYRGSAAAPEEKFKVGMSGLQTANSLGLAFMLTEPFLPASMSAQAESVPRADG